MNILTPLKLNCCRVLPIQLDDCLTAMECVYRILAYANRIAEQSNKNEENIAILGDYFHSADFKALLDAALDEMIASGELPDAVINKVAEVDKKLDDILVQLSGKADSTAVNHLPNFHKSYLQVGFADRNPGKVQPYFVVLNTKKNALAYLSGNIEGHSYIGMLNEDKCSVKDYHEIPTKHANDLTYDIKRNKYVVADMFIDGPSGNATVLEVDPDTYQYTRHVLPFKSELVACSYDEAKDNYWACGGESEGVFIYNFELGRLVSRTKVTMDIYGTVGQAIAQGSFMYKDKLVMVYSSISKGIGAPIGTQLYTFNTNTGEVDGRFYVDSLRGEVEGGYWDGKELRLPAYLGDYPGAYVMYCYTLDAPLVASDEETYVFLKDNCYGNGTDKSPAGSLAHALMTAQWQNCYVRVRLQGDVNDPFPKKFMCAHDIKVDIAPAEGFADCLLTGNLYIHNGCFTIDRIRLQGEYQFKNSRVCILDAKLLNSTNSATIDMTGGMITAHGLKYEAHSEYAVGIKMYAGCMGFLHCTEIVSDFSTAFLALVRGMCGYVVPESKLTDPVHAYEDGIAIDKKKWDNIPGTKEVTNV